MDYRDTVAMRKQADELAKKGFYEAAEKLRERAAEYDHWR